MPSSAACVPGGSAGSNPMRPLTLAGTAITATSPSNSAPPARTRTPPSPQATRSTGLDRRTRVAELRREGERDPLVPAGDARALVARGGRRPPRARRRRGGRRCCAHETSAPRQDRLARAGSRSSPSEEGAGRDRRTQDSGRAARARSTAPTAAASVSAGRRRCRRGAHGRRSAWPSPRGRGRSARRAPGERRCCRGRTNSAPISITARSASVLDQTRPPTRSRGLEDDDDPAPPRAKRVGRSPGRRSRLPPRWLGGSREAIG